MKTGLILLLGLIAYIYLVVEFASRQAKKSNDKLRAKLRKLGYEQSGVHLSITRHQFTNKP